MVNSNEVKYNLGKGACGEFGRSAANCSGSMLEMAAFFGFTKDWGFRWFSTQTNGTRSEDMMLFSVSGPPPSRRLFGKHYFLALETYLKTLVTRATKGSKEWLEVGHISLGRAHYIIVCTI